MACEKNRNQFYRSYKCDFFYKVFIFLNLFFILYIKIKSKSYFIDCYLTEKNSFLKILHS